MDDFSKLTTLRKHFQKNYDDDYEYEDESDYEYVDHDYDDAEDEDKYDDYRNIHAAYENIRNIQGIDTRYNKMWSGGSNNEQVQKARLSHVRYDLNKWRENMDLKHHLNRNRHHYRTRNFRHPSMPRVNKLHPIDTRPHSRVQTGKYHRNYLLNSNKRPVTGNGYEYYDDDEYYSDDEDGYYDDYDYDEEENTAPLTGNKYTNRNRMEWWIPLYIPKSNII